jgi:hypothetical protein
MHLRGDEILRIADDASNDWLDVETRSGRMVRQFDHEHAKRADIRIRTRMWLMSRFAPRCSATVCSWMPARRQWRL